MNDQHHRRLRDFEPFDEISLRVVPRYKTSGLSGDEWRTGVAIEYKFKGEVVAENWFTSMQTAILFLGADWVKKQEPIPDRVIEMEQQGYCSQPSCRSADTQKFRVKKLTSDRGEYLDLNHKAPFVYYRQFCNRHRRRGDCSREDCDSNYEKMQLNYERMK